MPSLPSVDRLARSLSGALPRKLAVDVARSAIDQARADGGDPVSIAQRAVEVLQLGRLRPVINATGVLLHTNLGRAPLDPGAAEAAQAAAIGYSNLEFDLAGGDRGRRGGQLGELVRVVTGAADSLVVNNNAAAVFLLLSSLAGGRSVPVSRGELIEIGGSYRLPELMAASGARLVEVGTTNRTRLDDYRHSLDPTTGVLLKVHPSNYRITGFTEEATVLELAGLAAETGVPLAFDAGSGLIDDRAPWLEGPSPGWLAREPGVVQSLQAGAGLVTFSGDKLLGGPQAGILVGATDLIGRLRSNPVARALRVDGPTLAALTVTFARYADGTAGRLPFWQMATASFEQLRQRAIALLAFCGVKGSVEPGMSTVGAGSVPGSDIPTALVVIPVDAGTRFLRLLRAEPMPVVARREAGRLVLDLRAVPAEYDQPLAAALGEACRS